VHVPYVHALWLHLAGREISVTGLMLFPLLIGGGEIVLILALVRYVFHERIGELNRKPGRWFRDVAAGVALCVATFALMIAHSVLLAPFLPRPAEPPQAVQTLFRALTENRWLLALWLGPVVWIGVAACEELSRVFVLDRIWKRWPGTGGRWTAIVLSSVMFGIVHIYQGISNVVGVAWMGLLYALVYLRLGRVWPLIVGHALFDSVQIISAVRAD